MATLREIRRRISSVRSTQQITKAMKMVAAAKMRRAQENIFATRPYARKLQEAMGHLFATIENSQDALLKVRTEEKVLVVVVSADRGLCGAFNSNIIRKASHIIADYQDKDVYVYPVGRKSYEYFSKRDYQLFDSKYNFFNHLKFEDAAEIVEKLVIAYESETFDKIEIVYNEFKSAIQQNLTLEQFLPFAPDEEMMEAQSQVDFLYDPGKESILHSLIPKHLNIQMWKILLESNAAEQGARMTAMESATDNAEDLIARLTLAYNRTRQAAITKEISEIVGGADALKES